MTTPIGALTGLVLRFALPLCAVRQLATRRFARRPRYGSTFPGRGPNNFPDSGAGAGGSLIAGRHHPPSHFAHHILHADVILMMRPAPWVYSATCRLEACREAMLWPSLSTARCLRSLELVHMRFWLSVFGMASCPPVISRAVRSFVPYHVPWSQSILALTGRIPNRPDCKNTNTPARFQHPATL